MADPPAAGDGPDAWDERYAGADSIWSGAPNGELVSELAELVPGRALDVGCGEGADAIWLTQQGWQVTALDVSRVAVDRARALAARAGVQVEWVVSGMVEAAPELGVFDLVSAQYPALRVTPGADAERALAALVAPGGTLLVVHHGDIDVGHARENGFDPADYVAPADVAAVLDDAWDVTLDERRQRQISGGAGAHHMHDVVLRAVRR